MILRPTMRKISLTAHIFFSVGWFGAVAAFLVLSIAGLQSTDAQTIRGAYISMNLIGQFLIVPLSFTALAMGLIQAFGTPWGLFRYYWVLVKFGLTIVATVILLLHQLTAVSDAARRVSETSPEILPNMGKLGIQLVGDAGFAVLVLLFITALSIFKPWGRTPCGVKSEEKHESKQAVIKDSLPLSLKFLFIAVGIIVVIFVVTHLMGHGLGNHNM